jgi:hypothetical protein
MARLLRKSATLIAVYSIALQAMLWGIVPADHFRLDPSAIICIAHGSGDPQPAPAQHRGDCDACLAACSSSSALLPASAASSFVIFADRPKRLSFVVEAPSLPRQHQPQESRAPPIPI